MTPPDRRIYWLLERASVSVRQRIERLAVEHLGATAAQLPVLFYLASHDGARPGELAEALAANPATITGLTSRMEAARLLRRRPAPDDGRSQVLSLTAAGRRIAERALPLVAELHAELLAGYAEAELEVVRRFLRTVSERAPSLGASLLPIVTDEGAAASSLAAPRRRFPSRRTS